MAIRKIHLGVMTRTVERVNGIDEENRKAALSFSSTFPVERWFGVEVLDHKPKSVRMGRLKDGGPLLENHDPDRLIGKVEEAKIADDRGSAVVRFGRTAVAEDAWTNVKDEILDRTSVGYRIYKMVLERDEENKPKVYRVTDWEPIEISLTAIPADPTTGIGRTDLSARGENECIVIEDALGEESNQEEERESYTMPEEVLTRSEVPAATPEKAPSVDLKLIREEGRQAERQRINTIRDMAERSNCRELGEKYISEDKTVEEFRDALLDVLVTRDDSPIKPVAGPDMIGMSKKEVREFSLRKLALGLASEPGSRELRDAAFELDACRATADKLGRSPKHGGVLLPPDVIHGTRDVTATTEAADLVQSGIQGFIDILRAKLLMAKLGRVMTGLKDSVLIPKLTTGAAAAFAAENTATSEQTAVFGQLLLTPKSLSCWTEVSRRLLIQSTPAVEQILRDDLVKAMATKFDDVAIEGGGSNEPTGILGTSGIGDVAGGANGLAPAWGHILELEEDVAVANAEVDDIVYLTNPKVRRKLKTVLKSAADTASNWIWDQDKEAPLNGYPCYITNQCPSDLDKGTSTGVCSAIIYGNFADLIMAIWDTMEIIVNPYSGDTTRLVRITCNNEVDVGVRQPASFSAMQDALTT